MRVLFVDDDRNILKDLESWAKSEGLEVAAVQSGVDAIRLLEADPNFDVAFVDLIMPGLHGLDTMTSLKKIKADLPVFLMAGPREMKLAERGVKAGAQGIIKKPIRYEEIEAALKKVFDHKSEKEVSCSGIDPSHIFELLQIIIDTPVSEATFEVLEREIKSRFPVKNMKVWSLSRETHTFEGLYPEDLPPVDLSPSGEYPDLVRGEEIAEYVGDSYQDDSILIFVKKRGKVFALVLVGLADGVDEGEVKLIGLIMGIVIHWLWLEESLARSIDIQARAEAEVEELRSKLARAVALMEKMKKHLKK